MFNAAMAFFGSFGFAIFFQIRGIKCLYVGIIGMIGSIVNYLVVIHTNQTLLALLMASIVATILGEIAARLLKTPATVFIVGSLIPLVPGGGMYNTMLKIVEGDVSQAVLLGLDTIGQAGAIVVGLTLVSSLFRAYKNAKELHFLENSIKK